MLCKLFFSFFQDGLKTADKLKQYIEKLATDLYNVCTLHWNWKLFTLYYVEKKKKGFISTELNFYYIRFLLYLPKNSFVLN